jgi:hypothetical protein
VLQSLIRQSTTDTVYGLRGILYVHTRHILCFIYTSSSSSSSSSQLRDVHCWIYDRSPQKFSTTIGLVLPSSSSFHQIVGPPCGPINAESPGMRSPFEKLSAPTAVSPPRNVPCPLPLEVCNSSGYNYIYIHTHA